jgi:hypothetical protein
MTGSRSLPTQVWRRSRYWATAACGIALLGGLLALASGHVIHGALLLLAALALVNGSVFGRRHRRRNLAQALTAEAVSSRRPERTAA